MLVVLEVLENSWTLANPVLWGGPISREGVCVMYVFYVVLLEIFPCMLLCIINYVDWVSYPK